jgi:hypothetical protein
LLALGIRELLFKVQEVVVEQGVMALLESMLVVMAASVINLVLLVPPHIMQAVEVAVHTTGRQARQQGMVVPAVEVKVVVIMLQDLMLLLIPEEAVVLVQRAEGLQIIHKV